MNRSSRTKARIRGFVLDELAEGRPSRDPLADGLLDSLAIGQLVAFCEEEFGISLDDGAVTAEHFESLDAVTALVESKRAP